MSSRFNSNLNQRDSRAALFSNFDSRASSQSPGKAGRSTDSRPSSGYGYGGYNSNASAGGGVGGGGPGANGPAFSAYPGASGTGGGVNGGMGFRSATPNSRGQYSNAVLDELESQNDEQLEGMTAKVRMLKDLTTAIGDEIRSSTTFAEGMNNAFETTRTRLRGTMNRMLRMAERSGIGWRAWLGFFAAVILLFWYVKLT